MRNKNYLMKCGHIAMGEDNKDGSPVCPLCYGLIKGADKIQGELPDLTEKVSKCSMCGKKTDSSYDLPFFKYNEDTFDTYYCGCMGWD